MERRLPVNADDLRSRLADLAAELRVRDRPERRAWARLAPTRSGWTTQVYDDVAFELWGGLLHRFPDDLTAVHHLAIMHHARAIDREQGEHPAESDPDWRQALAYWHRLYGTEEFWSELSRRADVTPDPVPRVRQDLAEALLGIHFDIALDDKSPNHRARFHVRLALDSPFPTDLTQGARQRAYERVTADMPAAVWRDGTLEPELLRPAIETIVRYLERDDNYPAALADLMGLLIRLQGGQVAYANGSVSPDERQHALDELRGTARQFDTYVTRLEEQLLSAAEPDPMALSDVALWHSRAGQACDANSAYEEAARFYQRAMRVARAGADQRAEEFRAEWLMATVLAARECAADDQNRARRLLSETAEYGPLPGLALLRRAWVWFDLGELGEAERDAQAAPGAPLGNGDVFAFPYDELRDACEGLRKRIGRIMEYGGQAAFSLQQEAVKAFNQERYDEAIAQLRRARETATPQARPRYDKEIADWLHTVAEIRLAAILPRTGSISPALLRPHRAALTQVSTLLAEAYGFDPKPEIRETLATVTRLLLMLPPGSP